MFDYVIIDAPPLGIFTDATVLINHADGALLVIRAGKTRYLHLTGFSKRFRETECWVLFLIKAKMFWMKVIIIMDITIQVGG